MGFKNNPCPLLTRPQKTLFLTFPPVVIQRTNRPKRALCVFPPNISLIWRNPCSADLSEYWKASDVNPSTFLLRFRVITKRPSCSFPFAKPIKLLHSSSFISLLQFTRCHFKVVQKSLQDDYFSAKCSNDIWVLMFPLFFIPSAGGYILDNFPRTREQFTSMIERNIVPDEVIYLRDDTDNGEFLLKRWYHTNKEGM